MYPRLSQRGVFWWQSVNLQARISKPRAYLRFFALITRTSLSVWILARLLSIVSLSDLVGDTLAGNPRWGSTHIINLASPYGSPLNYVSLLLAVLFGAHGRFIQLPARCLDSIYEGSQPTIHSWVLRYLPPESLKLITTPLVSASETQVERMVTR